MKLTKEQESKLTEMAFAEKGNKEIAQELDIELKDVHAARSRLGITIPKVKEALVKGFSSGVRTVEEIKAEIKKVDKAWTQAKNKATRCKDRLKELENELEAVK